MVCKTLVVSLIAVCNFTALAGNAARSAVIEKANNATNLTVGSSWVGGALPGSYDSAQWDSTLAGGNTVSCSGNLSLGQVIVLSPGGPVTINAPGTLTLNAPSGTGIDMSAATQNLTVNTPVVLGGGQTWSVATGTTLAVSGAISGGFGLTIAGSGTTVFSGPNTYSGGTTVQGGTLKTGSFGATGSSLAVLPGATLDLSGHNFTGQQVNYSVSLAGTGMGGNGAMIDSSGTGTVASVKLAADTTIGGNSPWNFYEPTPGTAVTGNGYSLTKTGSNFITFDGSPEEMTVAGVKNINVNSGMLSVFSRVTVDNSQPGSIYVNSGGTLGIDAGMFGGLTIQKPIVLAGGVLETGMSGQGSYTTLGAGISLNATGVFAPQANSTLLLSGTISDGTAPNGITVAGGAGSRFELTGPSTYSGDTTIGGGLLMLEGNNALPSGAGKGNVAVVVGATLDVEGRAVSVNGLLGAGTVDNLEGSGGTITIGNNNASSTFSGVLRNSDGTLSLVKSGTGALVLTGSNSYRGGTAIDGGEVALAGVGTLGALSGPLTLGGGMLDLGAGGLSVGAVRISAAPAGFNTIQNGTLTASSYAVTNTSGSVSVTANLMGNGAALTVSGGGTLVLSGQDTYGGDTIVSRGELIANTLTAIPGGTGLAVGIGALSFGPAVADSPGAAQPIIAAAPVPEPSTFPMLAAVTVSLAVCAWKSSMGRRR
jgi:autotransporter-associated beta strand protein